MSQTKGTAAVIGAGIVGICTALELQRVGYQVTIFDKTTPAKETSYGNASFIAVEVIEPQATPANILSAIKLLFSEKGALKVTPDHLLAFIPWSVQFLKEASKSRRDKSRDATIQLHKYTTDAWKSLLKSTENTDFLHKSGYLQVWEKASDISQAKQIQSEMHAVGFDCEILQGEALFEKEPTLSRTINHALYYPETLQLIEPYETALGLFGYFIKQGGKFQQAELTQLSPSDNRATLETSEGVFDFDKAVVCLGVWSKKLLAGIGLNIPLEVERGYHLTYLDSEVTFKHLIKSMDRHVVLTPLKTGMRITGFAEFAEVDSKPVEKRYKTLSNHMNSLIEGMDNYKQEPGEWMGRRPTLPDSLPVIDLHPKHPQIGMVFGHQHLGLTQSPISAKIITALIEGDKNNQTLKDFEGYLEAFSVSRF